MERCLKKKEIKVKKEKRHEKKGKIMKNLKDRYSVPKNITPL